ncbi:hypothetical protein ACF0H5_001516 [Mactra antiquata]
MIMDCHTRCCGCRQQVAGCRGWGVPPSVGKPPHNRLVIESRVTNSPVPHHFSEFYKSQLPQIGNIDSCRTTILGHQGTCGRCGSIHGLHHQCPARNRKCYKCGNYGHYANLCKTKNIKIKTEDKKEISCILEQTLCDMPFYEISDKELVQSNFNSSFRLYVQILEEADVQNDLLNYLLEEAEKTENELKEQNENLSTTITTMENEISNLNEEILQYKEQLKAMSEDILVFNQYSHKVVDNTEVIEGLMYDLELISSNFNSPSTYNQCGRCGLHNGHSNRQCPAKRNMCRRCYKTNHLTYLCKNSLPLEELVTSDLKLRNVMEKYKV